MLTSPTSPIPSYGTPTTYPITTWSGSAAGTPGGTPWNGGQNGGEFGQPIQSLPPAWTQPQLTPGFTQGFTQGSPQKTQPAYQTGYQTNYPTPTLNSPTQTPWGYAPATPYGSTSAPSTSYPTSTYWIPQNQTASSYPTPGYGQYASATTSSNPWGSATSGNSGRSYPTPSLPHPPTYKRSTSIYDYPAGSLDPAQSGAYQSYGTRPIVQAPPAPPKTEEPPPVAEAAPAQAPVIQEPPANELDTIIAEDPNNPSIIAEDPNAVEATPPQTQPSSEWQTSDTGLQFRDIQVGTGPQAVEGNVVKVNYRGTLEDGTEFDASNDFEFPLGLGLVIPGWEEGLQGMQAGGKRELIIPPDLAYGPDGSPPVIPPNATLHFEVELVSIAQ